MSAAAGMSMNADGIILSPFRNLCNRRAGCIFTDRIYIVTRLIKNSRRETALVLQSVPQCERLQLGTSCLWQVCELLVPVSQASALLEDGDGDEETAADLADQISGSGSGAGGKWQLGGGGVQRFNYPHREQTPFRRHMKQRTSNDSCNSSVALVG